MPTNLSVPGRFISATARLGSLLGLTLALHYVSRTLGFGALATLVMTVIVGGALWVQTRGSRRGDVSDPLPAVPLAITVLLIVSGSIPVWPGVNTNQPRWFRNSDDAYTLLIVRGLEHGFPPPDLSWAGAPLRYHHGTALLVDLFRGLTGLSASAVYYGILPIVIRLLLVGATLEIVRRVGPELNPGLRAWSPVAVSALVWIDPYAMAWHARDIMLRGLEGVKDLSSVPAVGWTGGIFSQAHYDSGDMAMAFVFFLIASWNRSTAVEKAALLFAVFLTKSQVFLPVGIGFAAASLRDLLRGKWSTGFAGAMGLAAALAAQASASTYGALARLRPGCGALCEVLTSRHHLDTVVAPLAATILETGNWAVGLHLFALCVIASSVAAWRRGDGSLVFASTTAAAGLAVPLGIRYEPSAELTRRFLEVHGGVAADLFMPIDGYLTSILQASVAAATSAADLLLPVLAIPFAASLAVRLRQPARAIAVTVLAAIAAVSAFSVTAAGTVRNTSRQKAIAPDAQAALVSIPSGPGSVITNDLRWDDVRERHLPLLNIWAPAASGRQFYASAFMFHFAHADAPRRLREVHWFFESANDRERIEFARRHGIGSVLMRLDLPGQRQPAAGWTRVMASGRYATYRLSGSPP